MIGINTISSLYGDKDINIITLSTKPKIIISPWINSIPEHKLI